ncbi:MAG: LPS-assembly protein LptD [Chitinophagaceae bacterium]|nr:MAG: LPS-assembly protein LptD [Chitinophagaceae bacterium]
MPDTIPPKVVITADTVLASTDTTSFGEDSIPVQRTDTFSLKLSKDTLDAPIKYYAEDSMVVSLRTKEIILYGKTQTEYNSITLNAPTVRLEQSTQTIHATSLKDSTGAITEKVKFKDGEQEFESDLIDVNMKTQKALTANTITQSDQLFVHGEKVKKVSKDVTFIDRGFFTTCNLDEPHFGFRANRMKLVNKKTAISGPVHPEFEGVPVPVYIPFGYFPLSQGRKSGLLAPQFATNDYTGLGLERLGYYKVINDYWDAQLYGNIYSYGSWSANINPTYRKRYRYQGAMNFGIQHSKFNFKGDPDYSVQNTFTLTWSHSTDTRARPGTSFTASVNASSTRYNERVTNNPIQNYQNQGTSSITYSKSWEAGYNLTASATHNQNNLTRTYDISLPNLGFSVPTIYPLQPKDYAGERKWYHQLGIGYQGTALNRISFYDTAFSLQKIKDTAMWGATHNIPITLSLPPILGGAVVVSPSVTYSQVWVSRETIRFWDTTGRSLPVPQRDSVTTIYRQGFNIDQQASFGLSFNTAMYGTYQFKNSRVVAIRHVIRPTFGMNYRPDLSSKFYDDVQIDSTGKTFGFSRLQGGITQGYSRGRSGGISFGLDNNVEMKVRNRKDTTGENAYKKIRLIDGFGFNSSYNFLADSFRLAPISIYFRNNLFDKINITASANMSPYKYDERGYEIDEYVWSDGIRLGRITNAQVSMSTTFQSKPRDEEKAKQRDENVNNQLNDPVLQNERQRLLEYMQQNPAEFVDFNIPWQFSLSYSFGYSSGFDAALARFNNITTSTASFNGSFSLTPKWNFSVSGYADIKTRRLENFNMAISREMHCWQLSITVTPVGYTKSFGFTISPKSGILQDLRINRNRSFFTAR